VGLEAAQDGVRRQLLFSGCGGVMMKHKMVLFCLFISVLLCLNSISFANLLFKMTADKYTLTVGQEATIDIWAKAEGATGLNGLDVWQLDMVVDTGNKVAVKTVGANAIITLIAPAPMYPLSGWTSVNSLLSGNVLGIRAYTLTTPQNSTTGVGNFSLLAEITIVALNEGTVTYNLISAGTTGFYGMLADSTYYDVGNAAPYAAVFQQGNNVFTVAPEPASIMIMTVMAGLALRSRRRSPAGK